VNHTQTILERPPAQEFAPVTRFVDSMIFALSVYQRANPGLDIDVIDKQPRASVRAIIGRLLSILGLITGLAIGAAATIALVDAEPLGAIQSE
jgi:hypothetical protein